MDFSEALRAMKDGDKVARGAWGSELTTFLYIVKASQFTVNRAPLLGIFNEGTQIQYAAHIDYCCLNAMGMPSCGVWAPEQGDVMANDWYIVQEDVAAKASAA